MTSDDQNQSQEPVYPAGPQKGPPPAGEPHDTPLPHVFLVCDNDGWGRTGPITRRLAVGLVDQAIRVSLICDHDCPANVALPGLHETYNLRKQGYLDALRPGRRFDNLEKFARRNQPTCIHATSLTSLETALNIRRILHVPILVSVDSLDDSRLNTLAGILAEDCRAVAMSTAIQDSLLARLPGNSRQAAFVDLIRPGVHTQQRLQPPFEPGAPFTLLVLEPAARSAGMEALLTAVAQILQNGINIMLFFIDSGPGETHLRKLAARLQVAEHVTFTGRFMRWPQTLGAADLVVLPQPQSQIHIYPLEAMASGTLIVAASGHCYDTIVDGKTGLEFDPRRHDDLSSKLISILKDPQRARTLAYAAQDKVRRDHPVSQMIDAHINLYKTLSGMTRA